MRTTFNKYLFYGHLLKEFKKRVEMNEKFDGCIMNARKMRKFQAGKLKITSTIEFKNQPVKKQ